MLANYHWFIFINSTQFIFVSFSQSVSGCFFFFLSRLSVYASLLIIFSYIHFVFVSFLVLAHYFCCLRFEFFTRFPAFALLKMCHTLYFVYVFSAQQKKILSAFSPFFTFCLFFHFLFFFISLVSASKLPYVWSSLRRTRTVRFMCVVIIPNYSLDGTRFYKRVRFAPKQSAQLVFDIFRFNIIYFFG